MKTALAGIVLASLSFCSSLTTVIQNHDQSSPAAGSELCAGLVDHLNVDLESSNAPHVGDVLLFSADPRTADGSTVPAECKDGSFAAVSVDGAVCTVDPASTRNAIAARALAVGDCSVHAQLGKAEGTSKPVRVLP
jgi:hypothetical protein